MTTLSHRISFLFAGLAVLLFTAVFVTGFRITNPGGAGTSHATLGGTSYSVNGTGSTTSVQGSRLTLTTSAPVGMTHAVLHGVSYGVQGSPLPASPRVRGSRLTLIVPGSHRSKAVVDGITYAVRP